MDPHAFAAAIFEKLRNGEPAEEFENARATIAAAAKFLFDGFGASQALGALDGMAHALKYESARRNGAGLVGQKASNDAAPVERQAEAGSVRADGPAPNDSSERHPQTGPSLTHRMDVMTDYLRKSDAADAQAEALAAMMAGAVYLRERFGEAYVIGALRHLETMTQRFTKLDRWKPETRAN